MLAITDQSNCLLVDQVLSAWDLGRNAALHEMNAPGSVTAAFEKRVDAETGKERIVHSPNQARADRYFRLPFADELKQDDALIECWVFTDNTYNQRTRSKIKVVDRQAYATAYEAAVQAVSEGKAGSVEDALRPHDFVKQVKNENLIEVTRADASAQLAQRYGVDSARISPQLGHVYVPKARYGDLLMPGIGAVTGTPSATSKLWVKLEQGFYFLRGWFDDGRAARCLRPKSFEA